FRSRRPPARAAARPSAGSLVVISLSCLPAGAGWWSRPGGASHLLDPDGAGLGDAGGVGLLLERGALAQR
ncbi:hypothetical protein ABE10_01110, partial [Bacillus toyonensis]|nr:hypothetical protein [Bacillus toyonensis]